MTARAAGCMALALAFGCGDSGAPSDARARVFVADERGGTVSVLDGETGRSIATVDLTERRADGSTTFLPHNVQVSPDGRQVWVTTASAEYYQRGYTGAGEEQLVVLDARDLAITARVPLHGLLAHVILDAEGRHVYVSASNADQVIVLDAATRAEVRRYDLGPRRAPHGMRICAGRLFVANGSGRSMSVIELASGAVREVPLGGTSIQVACTADGRYAFASLDGLRAVARYETATGTVERLALPPEARGPAQLFLAPDDRTLYVADQGQLVSTRTGDTLYALDPMTGAVRYSLEVGAAPHGVVVSRDGARVYVTHVVDDSVAIVDTNARAVVATVPVGRSPIGITWADSRGGVP